MNAEGLLAALAKMGDDLAQVQQMRKVIITLAISGKLTVGDCAIDSSHADDLDRSSTAFPATGRSAPRKKSAATINREDLPEGFFEPSRFVRLGSVATIEKGRTGIKGVTPGPYPMVVTAAARITSDHYDFDGAAAIVPLVSSTGHGKASLHRLHYQEGRFALGTILAAIIPHDPRQLSARFLYEYLTTFKEELLVSRMIGTANVSLSVGKIADVPLPLIDASTQQKVDELMALCDQLETARMQHEAARNRLAAASLARLNAPDPDTFPADARFALDALPALTTRPDQIKQLRQTILNLAVRGKLVPQDSADEPAGNILKRLLVAKRIQEEAPKKSRNRSHPEPEQEEGAFDLPTGWTWASTLEVCSHVDSGSTPPAAEMKEGAGEIPFIKVYNLTKTGKLDFSVKPTYVSKETHRTRLARSKILPNDVLMNIVGPPLGKVSIVPDTFPEWNTNQAVVLFRPLPELLPKYLATCLMSTSVLSWIIDLAQQTVGQVNISVSKSRRLPIPFPPPVEQHRIVAKVDELMALCDQLEASLTTGETTRRRLLDALLHEALAPVATPSSEHPRAAVSGYVVSRLAPKRNFGRTAHMKHLYLAESRLGLSLGGRYMREAAGPLDTGIYELEKQAAAAGWYTTSVETLASGNEKVSYKPGNAIKAIAEEGIAVLGPSRAEMDRLIDLMGGLKTEQVEIIATLFAAWNDALLDGHRPDDDWIVKEAREHWHISKQRFTPVELHRWLGWMRQNDVVPLGHPPRTMQQTTMAF